MVYSALIEYPDVSLVRYLGWEHLARLYNVGYKIYSYAKFNRCKILTFNVQLQNLVKMYFLDRKILYLAGS